MGEDKKVIKDQSALGQFMSAIVQISEEKGIDKDRVVEIVEAALAAAYKKDYGKKGQLIIAKMDEKNGEVIFKQLKEVVDEETRNLEKLEESEQSEEEREAVIDEEKKKAIEEARKQREEENKKQLKKAKKSEEVIEKHAAMPVTEENDEQHLPRFNSERDVLIEDAKKVDKNIEVGDFIEILLETKSDYGRVASQTAKQVIIQRLREAERDAMYDEYKGKEGEVINGVIQRIEGRNVFVDLGKAVGVMFYSNQIPGERYRIGQRIRVYIEKVESDPKGPGITLSRNHPELLRKLFELEVPEIFTGTVEIKAIAREAGSRAKIAVISNEEGIDPIGSCVGQKGTRVHAVIDELGGEKIDIIEWNDDVAKLIASALSPAKVVKVDIKESKKEAVAHVPEDQLSLTIGKNGQNVRLAAKLTGWKIDVLAIEGTAAKEAVEGDEDLEAKAANIEPEEENAEQAEAPEEEVKKEVKEESETKESAEETEEAEEVEDKKSAK